MKTKKLRDYKLKNNYTYANNDKYIKENNEDVIYKYIERKLDPEEEKYIYEEKTINYTEDWKNVIQVLEANDNILKNEKVKI